MRRRAVLGPTRSLPGTRTASSAAPWAELPAEQVVDRPVAVIDHERGGTAVESTRDGGVCFRGHQHPGDRVVMRPRHRLALGGDSCGAFRVCRDQHIHELFLIRTPSSGQLGVATKIPPGVRRMARSGGRSRLIA
jgi:hypothetical protein